MSKLMMTLKLDPAEATLACVRRKLNLAPDVLDPDFGVVSLDAEGNLYAILVDEEVAAKLAEAKTADGPNSNPIIVPFGPPTG